LKDYPDQAGYPLQKLKIRKEDQVPSIDFNDYQDYKKNQSAFDKVLSDHSKNLDSLLEAYNQGHVEVTASSPWSESFTIFPHNNHRLFLVMLSQKAHQGKAAEALQLLEKSNLFIINVIETPQSLINKMIALTDLKRNADFAR